MNIDPFISIPNEEHHCKGQPCEGGTYVYIDDSLYVCNKCGKLFKFYNEVKFMTIQEQIEKLKQDIKNANALFNTQLAALEEQLKAEEKKSRAWKPKLDECYYCISNGGVDYYRWKGDEYDEFVYATGDCFQTQEEAEWEKQHRIVKTELKHFVEENDPKPIKDRDFSVKYYIFYDCIDDIIDCSYNENFIIANQIYASSPAILIDAITHIGEERLKKYYFGVEK